jgi:hypothetical protein
MREKESERERTESGGDESILRYMVWVALSPESAPAR